MSDPEDKIRIGVLKLSVLASLAVGGLLRVTLGQSDDRRSQFVGVIPSDACEIFVISSTAGHFRPSTLAEVADLRTCISDDPDVVASFLGGDMGSRLSLMTRLGMSPPSKVLAVRREWQADLKRVRPWDGSRFGPMVRRLIAECALLGATGEHVRAACARVAERVMPWCVDEDEIRRRDLEIAGLIRGA